LNETLINFFGKGNDGKVKPNTTFSTHGNRCQLCHSKEHMALVCLKLINIKPKCTKCGRGHKIKNCSLTCSFCFGLGHTKDQCWKKFVKGLTTTTNFLEVLVNDEEATLVKINKIYGCQHVFSRIRIPNRRLPVAFG
jgi:hypothetical protein